MKHLMQLIYYQFCIYIYRHENIKTKHIIKRFVQNLKFKLNTKLRLKTQKY